MLVVVAAAVLLVVIPHNRCKRRADRGRRRGDRAGRHLDRDAVLRWRTTTYELTTRRFRLRYGVLSRTGRDFPLIRISDVSFSHGPIDRLLGRGGSSSSPPASTGNSCCTEIPEVGKVQATLFQLVEDEQARLAREDR